MMIYINENDRARPEGSAEPSLRRGRAPYRQDLSTQSSGSD